MTKSVGVHEAKTTLSRLLRLVEQGEEIDIVRSGVLVGRLVPPGSKNRREFDVDRGRFEVPDDFDEESPDIVRMFQ